MITAGCPDPADALRSTGTRRLFLKKSAAKPARGSCHACKPSAWPWRAWKKRGAHRRHRAVPPLVSRGRDCWIAGARPRCQRRQGASILARSHGSYFARNWPKGSGARPGTHSPGGKRSWGRNRCLGGLWPLGKARGAAESGAPQPPSKKTPTPEAAFRNGGLEEKLDALSIPAGRLWRVWVTDEARFGLHTVHRRSVEPARGAGGWFPTSRNTSGTTPAGPWR